MSSPAFDVFFCHNSNDKQAILELKRLLEEERLRVWLDQDQLPPGRLWQPLLEEGIGNSASIAVLIGKDGVGHWSNQEMQAALGMASRDGRPVIPVLLPGAAKDSALPPFLNIRTLVDFSPGFHPSAVEALYWGITGIKLTRVPAPGNEIAVTGDRQIDRLPRRVNIKFNCYSEVGEGTLHFRPCEIICNFCNSFPSTTFTFIKPATGETFSGKELTVMVMDAKFVHDQEVILEVDGECENIAAECVKVICENLHGLSDKPDVVKARLDTLITATIKRVNDPELSFFDESIYLLSKFAQKIHKRQSRAVATINDRFHDATIFVLSLVARYFQSKITLSFDDHEKGILSFEIGSGIDDGIDRQLVEAEIPIGTRITVVGEGGRDQEAVDGIVHILGNLCQCDDWLRRRIRRIEDPQFISSLLEVARRISKNQFGFFDYNKNTYVSNLVKRNKVIVNPESRTFSKLDAVTQMAASHSDEHPVDKAEIIAKFIDPELRRDLEWKPGFALLHSSIDHGPRLSVSFAVYPNGINWPDFERPVNLVAMVVFAHDTHRTWTDYLKIFVTLFRNNPKLISQLTQTKSSDEFLSILRAAEATQ